MDKLDIEYNYLINKKVNNFPLDFCVDRRIDPDSESKTLYDDILKAFFKKKNAVNFAQQYGSKPTFYTIRLNDEFLLSSDYIGPSVYWAREMGIDEDKIRTFLKSCRTIGGHIVWQRGNELKYKINTARGGNSGVYDRFDWTLLLLKLYLNSPQDEDAFINKSNRLIPEDFRNTKNVDDKYRNLFCAFDCSKWLKNYSFEDFCKQFKLCGNFVNAPIDALSSGKSNEFTEQLKEKQGICTYELLYARDFSQEQINEYNANRPKEDDTETELIVDFYRRFIYRMEYMMKIGKEKGFDLISFMGP